MVIILKIGLAEWGLREFPLEKHFEIASGLGAQYLEIGCGNEKEKYRFPQNPDNAYTENINKIANDNYVDTSFGAIGGGYAIEDEAELESLIAGQKAELDA